jgi:hypothetical protein
VVEGAGRKGDDGCGYGIGVTQDIRCRNMNYLISLFREFLRANLVTHRTIAHVVRYSIHLDHELGGRAIKVSAVGWDRMLLSECEALRLSLQTLPKQDFG